jgi:hypothetical protein
MLNLRQIARRPRVLRIRVRSIHCLASDLSTVPGPSRAPSIKFRRTALLRGLSKCTRPIVGAEGRVVRNHRARENALFDSLSSNFRNQEMVMSRAQNTC